MFKSWSEILRISEVYKFEKQPPEKYSKNLKIGKVSNLKIKK